MNEIVIENKENKSILVGMTSDVVSAYVSNNTVASSELTALIKEVYTAFRDVDLNEGAAANNQKPAVNPKKSIFPDFLICLEDGKKFKSLKRHLTAHFDMTPHEYREKWGLPSDYPMVAPNYSKKRSSLAREKGLGHKKSA